MVGFSRANQALLDAAADGDVAVAKAALAAGANPSVSWRWTRKKDNYANSALHIASERDHARVAELLIDAGADVEETNAGGATPLHVAAECGRDEMCIRLLAAGANIESKNHDGETRQTCSDAPRCTSRRRACQGSAKTFSPRGATRTPQT